VLFAILTWKRKSEVLDTPLESFFDSFAGAVRYMRYAPGVQIGDGLHRKSTVRSSSYSCS